jgi:glycosyltransferase involved in cell wall biosynthesis
VPVAVMSESTAGDRARRGWREAVKRRCVKACAAGLVGGERHREYLIELGMPRSRIFLGYDAVDNAHFARGATDARRDAAARRQELALPERYFLAVARFIAEKNLDALLRAYREYLNQCADGQGAATAWDLVVLGDGTMRTQLEQLCRELGVEGRVHFPGFKQYDELPAYYGLASAFVHASLVEPWGLVVNEAMSAGLPALVSERCGCAPTLVRDGENGWTFDPADVSAMSRRLRQMTDLSDEERRRLGAASATIVGDFGPERFASGLREAAEAAVAQRAPARRLTQSLLLAALLASAR